MLENDILIGFRGQNFLETGAKAPNLFWGFLFFYMKSRYLSI